MARAATASASDARDVPFSRHASLIGGPAYSKLLSGEPILRRSVPVLMFVFLFTLGLGRASQLIDRRFEVIANAQDEISLIATALSAALAGTDATSPEAVQSTLADRLPPRATRNMRHIFITGKDGKVLAQAPLQSRIAAAAAIERMERSQPLSVLGARAGVLAVTLADGAPAYATFHDIASDLGSVIVLQPEAGILADWEAELSVAVVLFVGTAFVVLLLGYAFYWQAERSRKTELLYQSAHRRVETALERGGCGLWDWDLGRGVMFWSRSMYEMLGMEPRQDLIGFGEVNALVHPDDGDLYEIADNMLDRTTETIDTTFRMRHADGRWIWLRARAERVTEGDGNTPHLIGIAVDITEQRRQAENTATADIRLRDAIEAISEAFVLWDAQNRLVICNSKYRELHRLSDIDAPPGTPYSNVMTAARQPVISTQIKAESRAAEGARTFEAELEDGRWLQINERRTKDGGFVSVGTDITALKSHEVKLMESERQLMATIADLRQSRQKLETQAQQLVELAEKYAREKNRAEAANLTKSEFLAHISHELRTPLNAIIGFSEIMNSELFGALGSERYVEYCRDIHQSGKYLLSVINSILEMSRLDAGKVVIVPETLAVDALVTEIVETVAAEPHSRHLSIETDMEEDIELVADRRAVSQIVLNLLSNAAKFTPEGGRVSVRVQRVEDGVQIIISDTGIGIPEAALNNLGLPFEQVEDPFSKKHKGAGLGLAIARSLAELHGGSLKIRSREEAGTTVTVTLPARPSSEGRTAGAAGSTRQEVS